MKNQLTHSVSKFADFFMILMTMGLLAGLIVFVITQNDTFVREEDRLLDTEIIERDVSVEPDGVSASERLASVAERDRQRVANAKLVQADLEAFYEQNQAYPTFEDFSDPAWRQANLLPPERDATIYTTLEFSYNIRPIFCENDFYGCTSYDISIDLEADGIGEDDFDGDTADATLLPLN